MKVAREWNDLHNWKRGGFGHDAALAKAQKPGSLALFCTACPQPGINLPDSWQNDDKPWRFRRVIMLDGNFKADHLNMMTARDVSLSQGLMFFVTDQGYKEHLSKTKEAQDKSRCSNHKAINLPNSVKKNRDVTGIGAAVCKHGYFLPHSVVDFHKGEQ